MSHSNSNHSFIFSNITVSDLTEKVIAQHTSGNIYIEAAQYLPVYPLSLELNSGIFTKSQGALTFPLVSVQQQGALLLLSCGCAAATGKLCEHEAQVLTAIIKNNEFLVFFDTALRKAKLSKAALDYGLENHPDPDLYFEFSYRHNVATISCRLPELLPVTTEQIRLMKDLLQVNISDPGIISDTLTKTVVVLRQHKYYGHLRIELYHAATTKDGKIKNPLTELNPLDFLWQTADPSHLKFYAAIHKFQQHPDRKKSLSDIAALLAIVTNPLSLDFYRHHSERSEQVTAASLLPVKISRLSGTPLLRVKKAAEFYELEITFDFNNLVSEPEELDFQFGYFLRTGNIFYLLEQLPVAGITELLYRHKGKLLVHSSKFNVFKDQFLDPVGDYINIRYSDIAPATPLQLETQGFSAKKELLLYLSDSGDHILLTPVMCYSDVEIPVRSKRQVYASDNNGKTFVVQRDDNAEIGFMALLIRQHDDFEEQLQENDLLHFYLHRECFLAEDWFLSAFEEWRAQGIFVLGFNELEGNRFNAHKIKIDIKVLSGQNWFNAVIQARFGKIKVPLKNLNKAIRNKSKYVPLDDGTLGILPQEWIDKFTAYFNAGEINGADSLQIRKINFAALEELYQPEAADDPVKGEIQLYREKLAATEEIKEVPLPEGLQGNLRSYQLQGLQWLNFLDDLNFGGCLADDMGLGKSIQIISFILLQRNKVKQNTNLLVVPATLLFSWQEEIDKFAPSLKVLWLHGRGRIRNNSNFDGYEVILTTYSTVITDVAFLKNYTFNYIFLDESQNIKNPETQRYQTVQQLNARNRIVITGTPVENNTFDLYSQLSFACPGLLGSKQYFRDTYSTPIDTFKNSKRAAELQQKVKPFILRRTKQQVARELPEKTELILYCNMESEQRKVYDAYEKEFREYIAAATNEELKHNPMNVLKGLTKLRQICDAPALLGAEHLTGSRSAKIDLLIEQLSVQAPQHKILVFSQFVSMLRLIATALDQQSIGYELLTGSTRNRGAVVQNFQNNATCRVFLISLKAGGTGLNLTQADYVYLVDPWWNPAVENQAIDRVHRIGQSQKVIAIRLICPDTVEEKILKMQAAKNALSKELIHADHFLPLLAKDELLGMLHSP